MPVTAHITSPRTGRTYNVDFDTDQITEQDIDDAAQHFDRLADQREAEKPVFGFRDALSGIGDALGGLTTTVPAAYHRLSEGFKRPDQYSPEARAAFDEEAAYTRRMQQESTDRLLRGEASSTGDAFRSAGPSLGFTAGSMGAAIPAGLAGAAIGAKVTAPAAAATGPAAPVVETAGTLIGGAIGAGSAAFGSAYRMAGAQFLDDAFAAVAEQRIARNEPWDEVEKEKAYAELLPLAENAALWEAGPEAIGNVVGLGAGKIVLGLGKPMLTQLAKGALGKLGIKTAALAAGVGTELITETATQIGQGEAQAKADALAAGQDMSQAKSPYDVPGGTWEAFKDVAPQTLALSGLMLGAGGAVKAATLPFRQPQSQMAADAAAVIASRTDRFTSSPSAAAPPRFEDDMDQGIGALEDVLREKARAFAAPAMQDVDAFFAEYQQQNPKIVDADQMRAMLHERAGKPEDVEFTRATDPVVAALSREYTRRRMQALPQGSRVGFLAGGPASGKTSARKEMPEIEDEVDMLIDAPMATQANAEASIEAARRAGHEVVITYLHTPLSKAAGFMLDRYEESQRETRAPVLADMHYRAQQTALNLADKYQSAPDVKVRLIDNAGEARKIISPAELRSVAYPNLDEAVKQTNLAIEDELKRRSEKPFWTEERKQAVTRPSGGSNGRPRDRRSQPPQSQQAGTEGNGGPGASSLKEWGKTTFGQRLKTDERLRTQWRQSIGGQYRVESEAEWQASANRFIADNGAGAAFALMTDPDSGLADSDRVAIGLQLILNLDAQIRAAEQAGDADTAAALDDLLYETAEWVELKGTKLGQAVRVFGMWTRMSAEGVLRAFERQVAEARQQDMQLKLGVDPEKLAADIQTTAAEEHADTASEALGETAAEQLAEMQQQIADLRQQLAQATQEASAARQESAQAATPADAAQASQNERQAEARRKQAQRALTAAEDAQQRKASEAGKPRPARQRKPRVLNPEEMAAKLIARLAQTPGQREARRKQSVNQVKKLAEDYTAGRIDSPALQAALEALGVEPDTSARLLQLLDVERAARQSTATSSAPPQRQPGDPRSLAWNYIDRLTFRHLIGGPPEPGPAAGALAQLIRAYIKAPDAASLPDFNTEARALGLPPAEAVELQRLLDLERAAIAQIARERAINRIVNQLAPKLPKTRDRMPRFLKKLFEAHELGALDRPDFLKAYAEAFELPVMDDAARKRIKTLIDAQKAAPEGFLKQQATTELMGELSKFKGIPAVDVLTAFWYANVLSGLTTQGVNIFGNASHLLLKILTIGATHNPRETWQFLRGLYEGARRGLTEGRAALVEGSVPYRNQLNFTQGQVLELIHRENPRTWRDRAVNFVALGRFIFRALQAGDAFFYHTAREGRAWLEASRHAATQATLNGGEFGQHMAEQLANGETRMAEAIAQAKAELAQIGQDGNYGRVDRRAWEIMEAQRPEDLNAQASRFGALTTFTQEPEGTMGAIAGLINDAHRRFSIPSPWGPIRVLTPFIPFVNIVANVTGTALDFTPVGIHRGLTGRYTRHTLDRSQKDFDSWEARQRLASGILGTLGAGLLMAWAMAFRERDDDEAPFMIYGMGPGTKARRDQMPKGWKPYTIKIGDTYLSYAETPLSLLLAIAGGAMDYLRYNPKGSEEHALGAMSYALGTSPQALLKTGVLSSLNDLFSLMEGERNATQFGTRFAAGFIPGQGLLRDVSELFEGTKIDDTTLAAGLFKDVPIIRGLVGKPALNIFGEPVELDTMQRLPIIKRVMTRQGDDPDTLWLARNKLWLPGIDNQIELGTYLTEQDKHRTQGAGWREDRVRQLGRAAADVLTPQERYKLVQLSGPGIRAAVRETRRIQTDFPEATRDQIQQRLNAKIVAHRRVAMQKLLGL